MLAAFQLVQEEWLRSIKGILENGAVSRLAALSKLLSNLPLPVLPDPSLFIYLYVRKEAVLSSQIEGTQSSFSDLMLFESAEPPASPWKTFSKFQIMWQR